MDKLFFKPFITKIFGVTLIELLVTVSITAVLAGLTIASMKTIRRPQDLVDNATDIIENLLNQANANSVNTDSDQLVCSLIAGSGSTLAQCPTTTTTPTISTSCPIPTNTTACTAACTWGNVNGSTFQRVTICVGPSNVITYSKGLMPRDASNNVNKYTITITSQDSTTCYNTITVWPNGVLDVTNNCS